VWFLDEAGGGSMAMGRRKRERQESLFVSTADLPKSAGHPFYRALNRLLAEAGFDGWVEARCAPYYEQEEKRGQPSIPPGVYVRMLMVGYFEGIASQRGIAWRCADSLALREFLGIPLSEDTPDHSTLTNTRKRLPREVFDEIFQFALKIAVEKQLLSGRTVGVDSTTLEANAAMKSIVRRDTGEDWNEYVTRLMREDGVIEADDEPSDEEIRRYDKGRKNKRVSNDEWVSATDPESRITQMKDGRTHLAYKAEHVVDLASDLILGAEIYAANLADNRTLVESVIEAYVNVDATGHEPRIEEVVADKGYHAAATLAECDRLSLRTYIPEPKRPHESRWTDKPADFERCVSNNRRRLSRAKSKKLQRRRSELCERTFAHICETGGMRRSWLRGLEDVSKRYSIAAAAHNLGRILRSLFGIGKPRALQGEGGTSSLTQLVIARLLAILSAFVRPPTRQTPDRLCRAG
jgi:transposase